MNAKQTRKAKRHFLRTSGPKLIELRMLGASRMTVMHVRDIGSASLLQATINNYRGGRTP